MIDTAQQIHKQLTNATGIVIVPHPHPDGDALGSASAIFEYLNKHNREAIIYCSTPINARLRFLPNFPPISPDEKIFSENKIDTIVVLDSGDLRYAGIAEIVKNHSAKIINIDHHSTNEHFGHHNFVLTEAASTTEIIFQYFELINEEVSPNMATNLLAGLISDTDSFTNSATGPKTLAIAGELVRRGANYKLVSFHTYKDKSLAILKLWGAALSRLVKNEKLNLAYTYLKQDDFQSVGLSENDGDGLANFMNNIDGPKITLVLKETAEGKIKGSFRTTEEGIDVSRLAKQLGGGGHKKAAGFTADGTIESVISAILTLNEK